mmetsp:Transcript_39051/g.110342  ORF Transcript_39051/g.110342 Transcript_39051/m.110342 type:complete len:426 (-) Transcript_39051:622-1899(-)
MQCAAQKPCPDAGGAASAVWGLAVGPLPRTSSLCRRDAAAARALSSFARQGAADGVVRDATAHGPHVVAAASAATPVGHGNFDLQCARAELHHRLCCPLPREGHGYHHGEAHGPDGATFPFPRACSITAFHREGGTRCGRAAPAIDADEVDRAPVPGRDSQGVEGERVAGVAVEAWKHAGRSAPRLVAEGDGALRSSRHRPHQARPRGRCHRPCRCNSIAACAVDAPRTRYGRGQWSLCNSRSVCQRRLLPLHGNGSGGGPCCSPCRSVPGTACGLHTGRGRRGPICNLSTCAAVGGVHAQRRGVLDASVEQEQQPVVLRRQFTGHEVLDLLLRQRRRTRGHSRIGGIYSAVRLGAPVGRRRRPVVRRRGRRGPDVRWLARRLWPRWFSEAIRIAGVATGAARRGLVTVIVVARVTALEAARRTR